MIQACLPCGAVFCSFLCGFSLLKGNTKDKGLMDHNHYRSRNQFIFMWIEYDRIGAKWITRHREASVPSSHFCAFRILSSQLTWQFPGFLSAIFWGFIDKALSETQEFASGLAERGQFFSFCDFSIGSPVANMAIQGGRPRGQSNCCQISSCIDAPILSSHRCC